MSWPDPASATQRTPEFVAGSVARVLHEQRPKTAPLAPLYQSERVK